MPEREISILPPEISLPKRVDPFLMHFKEAIP
jgi:hypothetical protein